MSYDVYEDFTFFKYNIYNTMCFVLFRVVLLLDMACEPMNLPHLPSPVAEDHNTPRHFEDCAGLGTAQTWSGHSVAPGGIEIGGL